MGESRKSGMVAWLKRLEAKGDAWAQKRLSQEEFADAVALDVALKRNFWRWIAIYLGIALVVTLILMGFKPAGSPWRAFFLANVICVSTLISVLSAWYGYRKYAEGQGWKVIAKLVVLMVAGAVVGLVFGAMADGKPLSSLTTEKMTQLLSMAMLLALGFAAVLIGLARLRSREVALRAQRLEADAERERYSRQSMQAELKLLQAQVEPHFLFNTLANLRFLVQTGSPDALAMLDHLIHYLRTSLPELRAESSTLGREAELARAYLEIMRLRMGGSLEIAIDIPAELSRVAIPPLMVMTLVENAVKHGITPVGKGRVTLSARCEDERVTVTVADNGRGIQEPIGRGVGLANVRERLRALYGDAARLDLASGEAPGTVATLEVPR